MRKFISRIFGGGAPKPSPTPIELCTHHNSSKHPIMAYEACLECQAPMCYICASGHHLKQHHTKRKLEASSVAEFVNPPPPTYRSEESLKKLVKFNHGHVAELNIINLKCICGKPLNETSAMCAACATATCSEHCHHEWSKQGNCTFHLNFGVHASKTGSVRSILFSNIMNLRKARHPPGTKANKTSSHMVCCYLSDNPQTVLLQRGYRIYGHPNEQHLELMSIQPKNLDYYMHLERACNCSCRTCTSLGLHSTMNCLDTCQDHRPRVLQQLCHNEEYKYECECDCAFCKTSVINNKHIRLNCSLNCEHSLQRFN